MRPAAYETRCKPSRTRLRFARVSAFLVRHSGIYLTMCFVPVLLPQTSHTSMSQYGTAHTHKGRLLEKRTMNATLYHDLKYPTNMTPPLIPAPVPPNHILFHTRVVPPLQKEIKPHLAASCSDNARHPDNLETVNRIPFQQHSNRKRKRKTVDRDFDFIFRISQIIVAKQYFKYGIPRL